MFEVSYCLEMAAVWPPHEFVTLTNQPALYIDGHKVLTNTKRRKDGITKAYMYCQNKLACKASATAIFSDAPYIERGVSTYQDVCRSFCSHHFSRGLVRNKKNKSDFDDDKSGRGYLRRCGLFLN